MSDSIDPAQLKSYSPNAKWAQSHRPECVSAIGLILLAWNRTEEQLAWTISGIMGITLIGDEGIGHSSDWIMATVMAETGTVHARIKIVDAILKKALEGHPLRDTWATIRQRLRPLADRRNVVVHTSWAWSEEQPGYLLQIERDGKVWGWNERHFSNLFDDIKSMEEEVHAFMIAVADELRAGTLTSPYLTPKKIPQF